MGVALLALGGLVPQMVKLPLAAGQGLACVLLVQAGMAVKPLSGGLGAGTRWVLGLALLATGIAAFALGALPLDLKVLHLGTPGVSVLASLAIVVGAVLLPCACRVRLVRRRRGWRASRSPCSSTRCSSCCWTG